MNAYPPLPPFFPSQHRLPGHGPTPAQEHRRRAEAVILPLEVHLARRIFPARRAPSVRHQTVTPDPLRFDQALGASLVIQALLRLLRGLIGRR